MLNNSFQKTSRGVKLNDAVKTGDADKRPHQLEREKSQGYGTNQYSSYRNFNKNVRYSSFSDKISFDNRQRDEYKMARGSYTRKPTRIVTKRDYDVSSNARRKFQDSSKDFGGSEDTRISKTLRRMVREDDPDTFSSLCIQLQESIIVVENERYIRKAMEFICESILDMLHSGPCYETRFMAAKCLSHLAIALEGDAKRFFDWIFTKYFEERNKEVRSLLMRSVYHMLELDKDHVLADFAPLLVSNIQNILENAEVPDLVLVTGRICNLLMIEYIDVFGEFFKDTVDILVGWHIDVEQSQSVIRVMSSCLQSLAPYWISELGFTVSLLGQLLEDMERYASDYHQICLNYASVKAETEEVTNGKDAVSLKLDSLRCLAKTMSFMKVFNSISKTVGQYLSPAVSSTYVTWNFLVESLTKVVRTNLLCMETGNVDEELIITGNESAWLLISLMKSKLNPGQDTLCKLISMQLSNASGYGNTTLASMLQLIAKVVKEGSANLPENLIKELLGSESNILKLRFSTNIEVHRGVVAVYQSLLNLKNIPLLQEAYKYILGDMEKAYLVLDSTANAFFADNPHADSLEYTSQMAQTVLLFHLKALSDLANAGGSIIGMWVLQPCILELLAVKLRPCALNWNPGIRYAILFLLYSHCLRYSNFISSSDVITSVQGRTNMCDILRIMGSDITPTSSPTSGHLTIILDLLTQLLKMPDLDVECTLLVLRWCGVLLNNAQMYLNPLLMSKEFVQMMETLIQFGCDCTDHFAIEIVLDNIIISLVTPSNWDTKPNLLQNIAELCFIHLNSMNESVKDKCKEILLKLPWSSVITVLRAISQKHSGAFNRIVSAYRTHMSRGTNGEMQSQHFKLFLSYILDNSVDDQTPLFLDSFFNCWNSAETKSDFANMVPCFESALLFWETWECAQYCVTNKLRTTLGKPQDTFMAIEGTLKNLARETTRKHTESDAGFDLKRVRLLLEFVEQLEKSIYNASDGTAAALLAAPKPVRTFFHTNKSTCGEWLSRIRLIIVMVSLHAGLSTTAIRHGYCLLQDMAQAGNTKGSDFENAVMYVSWALYSLHESEAIEGLYAWCNDSIGVSFPFLKALSDQAAFRYETALEMYLRLVDEVDNSLSLRTSELSLSDSVRSSDSISDTLRSFVADQITECYLDLNNWAQLKEWKKQEADFLSVINGSSVQRYNHFTVKEANMHYEIDAGNYSGALALMDWGDLSTTNKSVQSGWNTRHLLTQTKQTLLEKFLSLSTDEADCKRDIGVMNDYANAVDLFLCVDVRNLPSPLIEEFVTLFYAVSFYFPESRTLNNFIMEIGGKKMGSKRLGDALWWTKIIENYRKHNWAVTKQVNLSELYLQLIKSARKEGNMHLASRQLLNHFEKVFCSLGAAKNFDNGRKPYNILLETITNQSTAAATTAIWSVDNTDALLELSKLAHRYNNEELAIEICAMTALGITHAGGIGDPFIRDKTSRLLLKLAKWLSADLICSDASMPFASCPTIQKLMALLSHNIKPVNPSPSFEIMSHDFSTSVIPEKDVTVGNLLRISVVQSPTLAKAWNRFGNWCYKWGRTVVDKQSNILTTADKTSIDGFVPSELTNKEDVYSILTRIKPPVDEEDIEADNVNTTELIEWQLRSTGQFSEEQMAGLIEIWRTTHARIYAYYHLAAQAYFKYLQLSDFNENGAETVTATLRLLRLIVKYSLELQSVFEVELGFTPTTPWKCIIPQLFSRLSHPEPYVRRRISELLSRLAEDAPHLITFPAVVGSDSGATGTINNMPTSKLFKSCLPTETEVDPEGIQDEDEIEEEDDDEVSQDDQGRILENCYLAMVDALAKQVPETISQVQLLVGELRRITLLWDELWLGALTQHETDMARRINQLGVEVTRIDANRHLTDAEKDAFVLEKYTVLLRPLLFILEQLEAITSVKPETPHEQWFQKTFGESITSTIHTLQNPKDPRKPQDAWKAVKLLQCQFQRRANKRSSYVLKMSDISPALAALKSTSIAMPGVEQYITIASVLNQVSVLPTKTKPKKLVFLGSDGKMYTYLFKGLEDLHLDERIMQFLSIANTMLKESGYQARHYSVIPLGPRSGLISWVDHVTPIFAVYKRWQQREAVVNNQTSVMRPSDLFYAKLTPLLKEHGITNQENNRKEWPVTVLVQVLTALMKETPDDLLAKELWCQSVNAGVWWKSLKLYSTSLAVMSVIGYIIGLGDRHLDNVLVHLTTGEVVHIDYNVCFDKGKSLRVPEKVPFRMTPNLRRALGVTGVEGTFRLTCERVMEVLKNGRETLLTLLEAFVYDPLIDWTPGIETGYTGAVYGGGRALALKNKQSRKQLEKEVTSSMFTIRMAEIKADWFENRDKINSGIDKLCACIENWLLTEKNLERVMDGLAKGSQQLEVLKAAAAHPQHHLYSLHSRYQSRKDASEAMIKAQIGLKQKLEECDSQLSQFKALFYHLRGEQLSQWMTDISAHQERESILFDVIMDFLKSTGVNQLITHCVQSETELKDAIKTQIPLAIGCLDSLKKYSMVSSLYPASSLLTHRSASFKRWVHMMLEFPSPNMCDTVLSEFNLLYVVSVGNDGVKQQAIKFSENIHQRISEMEYSLKARVEKLEKLNNDAEIDIVQMEQAIQKMAENQTLTLQCAVINELCQLNKRFLKMETAALGAGNCLMVLTTLDGEWFLDDMCLMTEVSIKLASYILSPTLLESNPGIHLVTKCLDLLHGIYKRLQELNVSFSTIIIPETMKKLLVEDESVLEMISKLNLIISTCSLPLPELIKELQTHLRYMIMGMPSPHPNCIAVATELRCNFNALINESSNPISGAMTEGQMLLMGFNVLFNNIFKNTADLFSLLPALAMTNTTWNSVDLIKDTRSLIGPVFNKESQILLQDLFLVKYIHTMHEFFRKCQMTAAAYRGGINMPTVYHSDDELEKLIKKFTADYLSQQLLGLFSYTFATTIGLFLQHIGFNIIAEVEQRDIGAESKVPMEELCQKAIEQQRQRESIVAGSYSHASSILNNLQLAWKRIAVSQKSTLEIKSQELMIQNLKLQYTAHHWLQEDALNDQSLPAPLINRSQFMIEMRSTLTSLITAQMKITELKEQQETLITSVRTRLKWAAGSNPSLNDVMNTFEEKVKTENENFTRYHQLMGTIINMCTYILQYESLRVHTAETIPLNTQFVQLVNNYKEACNMVMSLATATFTPEEENLIQLLQPTNPIDNNWINEADILISESLKQLGHELEPLKNCVTNARDEVKSMATSLRVLLSEHHKIFVDVRSLLKSMMKFDDNDEFATIPDYLHRHKAFREQLSSLTKDLSSTELTEMKGQMSLKQLRLVQLQMDYIYEEILKFAVDKQPTKLKRPPLLRQESIHLSPKKRLPHDPRTGKILQEKNEYAVNVWRRVRMKLEGRDTDHCDGRKLSVHEQIDKIIKDSTNIDNLALLYEGWTPWV